MSDYLKKHSYIFFFLICTGYQLLFYKYGLNLWDEGDLAYGALRVLNSEIPLIDFGFDGYPPGRYLLSALFFKIFGVNLPSIRLLFALLTSLMVILFYRVSKNLMDKNFSIISSLLLLSAPSMYYNRLFPIMTVINIYFIAKYINSERKSDLISSFFVILVTFLMKVEIGLISLTVLSIVFALHSIRLQNRISFSFKNLKFINKISVIVIIFFAAGILAAAIKIGFPRKIFEIIFQMHSVWGNPFPSLFPSRENNFSSFQEFFDASLFYQPIVVYVAAVILLLKRRGFFCKNTTLNKCNLHILVVLLFGIGTYGLVVWRAGFDNLLRVLPAFYILLCYFLFLLYKKIVQYRTGADLMYRNFEKVGQGWPNLKTQFKKFILLIPVLLFPAFFIVSFNLYHGFYAGSIGELRKNHVYIDFDRARVFADPIEAMWISDIVLYIKRTTTANDPVFALPLNPIWYFFSDRKNPTSYNWVLPQTIKLLGVEQKIIEQLNANPPKVIIYADIAIDGKEERRLSNYAPKIFEYITNNYKLEKLVGPFYLLQRKS